jgi:ERCC4-related helicase
MARPHPRRTPYREAPLLAGVAARSPPVSEAPPSADAGRKPQRTLDDFDSGATAEDAPSSPPVPTPPPLPEGMGIAEDPQGFVEQSLLRPRQVRAFPFQIAITKAALEQDVLVVLPTGLGKTVIAALVAAERLRCRRGKVLFLAPTRPLVEQHARSFAGWFRSLPRATFTGTVSSPKREGTWEPAEAIFATPQLVVNDLEEGRYSLADVGLLIFDEAHRTVGKYAYVRIASIYRTQRASDRRLLGLTASPGGKATKIDEVLGALGVARVEARSREDPDVADYVQDVETRHVRVQLPPELEEVRLGLRTGGHDAMVRLQRMGFLRGKPLRVTGVKDLLATRGMIMARPGSMGRKFGALYQLMLAMHFHHAGELLETQGVEPLLDYVDRIAGKEKPGRADKAFLAHPSVVKARQVGKAYLASPSSTSHPKLDELASVITETLQGSSKAKVLVFAQFRDTVRSIVDELRSRNIEARRFVGQATRSEEDQGMDQKEQARVLDDFRSGRFPVLVASSVAEEGIDIPDVDLVVFFEALPSEIRTLQRKGRTGRSSSGRVVILMTQGTRDEGYLRAQGKRESAMRRHVRRFSENGKVAEGTGKRVASGEESPPAPARRRSRTRSSDPEPDPAPSS